MKKTLSSILYVFLYVFLFVWMLPMNILGIGCWLIYRPKEKRKFGHVTYYHFSSKLGSISLGRFIFLCDGHWDDVETQKHEYGHFIQGLILSWTQLFVTAIPSIIWAGLFEKWRIKHGRSYYWFYTESWANKLGRVTRQ